VDHLRTTWQVSIRRACAALEAERSPLRLQSLYVAQTLDLAGKAVGYPRVIRVDNGTEFVSRDLELWAYQRGVILDFNRPGKPTDNAFAEAFNGKVGAECLNTACFMSLDDARSKRDAWHSDYNEHRPHCAIGDKRTIELMNGAGTHGPPSAFPARRSRPIIVKVGGQGHGHHPILAPESVGRPLDYRQATRAHQRAD